MMFYKFLRFDFKNGILHQWKTFACTGVLFFLGAALHCLTLRVLSITRPEYLQTPPTVGDYMITVFAGVRAHAAQEMGSSFEMPFLWLFYLCWILFTVLRYPLEELAGVGKHLLVLSRSRTHWWCSKCIWVCASTTFTFAAALLGMALCGVCFGARPSLQVSGYIPTLLNFTSEHMAPEPWDISLLLLANLALLIAAGLVQLTLSLYIKQLYSYLFVVGYLLAGTYLPNKPLLSSYMMGARSSIFLQPGNDPLVGIAAALWLGCISVAIGWYRFSYYDILDVLN
ncbi:MAG: hypothetical protein PHG73_04715 [Pygmaiobacter sp.]|nr:hypothetical protein [Pygmaiobacter sp.]